MTIDEAIAHAQETADTRTDLCDECREEHRQLAQWLIELKQLREENDTLKTEIMAVKSGSDVLKICKLEEENKELKRLMRLAVDDLAWSNCNMGDNNECPDCPYYSGKPGKCLHDWKHVEEALKLIGDEGDA